MTRRAADKFGKESAVPLRDRAITLLGGAITSVKEGAKFTPRTVKALRNMVKTITDLDPDQDLNKPMQDGLNELLALLPEGVTK